MLMSSSLSSVTSLLTDLGICHCVHLHIPFIVTTWRVTSLPIHISEGPV